MPALGEDQGEECVVVVTGLRRAQLDLVGILKRPGVCVCQREGPVRHCGGAVPLALTVGVVRNSCCLTDARKPVSTAPPSETTGGE